MSGLVPFDLQDPASFSSAAIVQEKDPESNAAWHQTMQTAPKSLTALPIPGKMLRFLWFFWGMITQALMKLTRRQEVFIRNLLDLYRELKGPIHYSVLAERVGVSPFTAYDMLRLLEEKGLVASDYQRAADKSGPGRSVVVFSPTPQARQSIALLVGHADSEEWEAAKERLLEKFRSGALPDHELVSQLLARVPPEGPGALRYCVEVMTVIALRLQSKDGRGLLREYLPHILPTAGAANRADLSLLGGFALGVLADEKFGDPEWVYELFQHVKRYQVLVMEMGPERLRRLATSLSEVFAPFLEMPSS